MHKTSVSATDAKNHFALVLERAIQGETIFVTKHDVPKAVILSIEEFNALANSPTNQLNTLSAEFDALLDGMQTPKARVGLKDAFGASPAKLGKAAVEAARKRG
jgi:prevent-host-death family protein